MTKRHYLTSVAIFLAAAFFVKNVLELHWFETVMLMLLIIVCVIHTMDVRDDMLEKAAKKKLEKKNGESTA